MGLEYGRVSFDVLQLKWYMTSAPGMIGMKESGSDGSYSSSASSLSPVEGPESLEGHGVEPRLSHTGPVPLLKHRLIIYALFRAGYDSTYECASTFSFQIPHMVGVLSQAQGAA